MKALHMIGFILLVIGGINWGLVGAFHWNLVEAIIGANTVTDIIYILVGLSAIYLFFTHKKDCMTCKKSSASAAQM